MSWNKIRSYWAVKYISLISSKIRTKTSEIYFTASRSSHALHIGQITNDMNASYNKCDKRSYREIYHDT